MPETEIEMKKIEQSTEAIKSTSSAISTAQVKPMPQQSLKKQLRTLTRTAELDADGDTDDAEVEAIVEGALNAGGSGGACLNENPESVVNASKITTTSTTTIATAQLTIAGVKEKNEQQNNGKANAIISDGILGTVTNTAVTSNTNADADAVSGTSNSPVMFNNKKPFKIKDVTRNIRKSLVAGSLAEMRPKVAEKFNQSIDKLPSIHLDSDGTEIDDEEYFRTLEDNTELIAVFPGQQWLDPLDYTALTVDHERNVRRSSLETRNLRKLVGQWKQNLINDTDLESLSNMDPNSLTDITGKELFEHIKDSGTFSSDSNHELSFRKRLRLFFYYFKLQLRFFGSRIYYFFYDGCMRFRYKITFFKAKLYDLQNFLVKGEDKNSLKAHYHMTVLVSDGMIFQRCQIW